MIPLLAPLLLAGCASGFTDGFAALAAQLPPAIVGEPRDCPYMDPWVYIDDTGNYFPWSPQIPVDQSYHPGGHLAGNVVQPTTRGEFEWQKATNLNTYVYECRSDGQTDCPQRFHLADDGSAVRDDDEVAI